MCSNECRKIWMSMPENTEYRIKRVKDENIKNME